jgi:CHAD domain-containing protein
MEQDYIKLKEIKPELAGYISEAQMLLKKSPIPDDASVHDMRVLLKKARSVLKLISPQVDSEYNQKDIPSLKEAAGIMSAWRDSTVYRKTLKELRKDFPQIFSQLKENEKITFLMKKPEPLKEPDPEVVSGIREIDSLLKKTGYRIRFTKLDTNPELLLKELEQTYLKVVDMFLVCRNKPKEPGFHELRKKTKDFLYQLYFFRPLNSQAVKALEKKLEAMTRNLGKVNDLAQLVKALDYRYPNDLNAPVLDELVVRIREKQDEYLSKAWPTASKYFCPGKRLVNLLGYKVLI